MECQHWSEPWSAHITVAGAIITGVIVAIVVIHASWSGAERAQEGTECTGGQEVPSVLSREGERRECALQHCG